MAGTPGADAPVILVHGLFGWGERRPFFGAGPEYFPIESLRSARPDAIILAPAIGSSSSSYDRACELFAQLRGVRTDYGVEHSQRCCHMQFGDDHTGHALLAQWDSSYPVHLVGHSFGGCTALVLLTLLAEDHWGVSSSAAWVLSLTTIVSPLRGCTLPVVLGLEGASSFIAKGATGGALSSLPAVSHAEGRAPRLFSAGHLLCIGVGPLLKASAHCSMLRGLYDFRVSQWAEHATLYNLFSPRGFSSHPFWTSRDNMLAECLPAAQAALLRASRRHLHNVYLVAVTADAVAPFGNSAVALARWDFSHTRPPLAPGSLIASVLAVLASVEMARRRGAARHFTTVWALLVARVRSGHGGTRLRTVQLAALVASITVSVAGRYGLTAVKNAINTAAIRSLLHRFAVLPVLRLCSTAIHGAAEVEPQVNGGVRETVADNDGFVDLSSQRGIDSAVSSCTVPHAAVGARNRSGWTPGCASLQSPGSCTTASVDGGGDIDADDAADTEVISNVVEGGMRDRSTSAIDLRCDADARAAADVQGMARAFSTVELTHGVTPRLLRGRWHVIRVAGADHCLGTWLSSQSEAMYQGLFSLLDSTVRARGAAVPPPPMSSDQ